MDRITFRKRFISLSLPILGLVMLFTGGYLFRVYAQSTDPTSSAANAHPAISQSPTDTLTYSAAAYIPMIVIDPTPLPEPTLLPTLAPSPQPTPDVQEQTVFGTGIYDLVRGAQLMADAGNSWVRPVGLDWDKVEPTEGARNWGAVAKIEADLREAARLKLRTVLIVHGTPAWAQKVKGSICGPIASAKFEAFGRFLRDAVARYTAPPFDVKYWEVWNEPDSPVRYDAQGWGCWGDPTDAYYGGRYFAQALKVAYENIKAANPATQVVLGGMLANCDPVRPPPGRNCASSKFFEGILLGGGGAYFDIFNFHTYDYFYSGVGQYGSENWHSSWNTTGPLLVIKGRFFKNLMQKYNVTGKGIMNTELAVLCSSCSANSPNYELTKAYYIAQSYAATIAEGYLASFWFSLEGWYGTELVDANFSPKPALTAMRVGREQLGDATFVAEITSADVGTTNVAGYKFQRDGKVVWLIWSKNGTTRTVKLNSKPATMTDALGATFAPANTFALTLKPIYVTWDN